jgi:anti-sigma regulatory factor (Ser/Thr protein kinase)
MLVTAQESETARTFRIGRRTDVLVASCDAREWARARGLGRQRSAELAIVVAELASNIVKHAVSGELALCFDPAALPRGEIRVVASDEGPPIHDFELAKIDGSDDRGPIDPAVLFGRRGLGTGLGAVARLADGLECRQDGSGKALTALFRL